MIEFEEIKNKALEYAKRFCNDNFELLKSDMDKYDAKQWYLIERLANIYYNLINNSITREEAKIEQNKAIKFVQEHTDIFEEIQE
jgi:phenolic acid decarboxylase